MSKLIAGFVFWVVLASPGVAQSPPSIQGVWRNIERVIPAASASDRRDPFGHVPTGVQRDVQPGLLILTKGYFRLREALRDSVSS